MATGDIISVTITWPSKGAVSAYITRLTGDVDGIQTFNTDLNTLSWVTNVVSGYKYHQETYYVDDSGTHLAKSLDFIAGQPEPPPTDLEVFALDICPSADRILVFILTDFSVNPSFTEQITNFNLNGTYRLLPQMDGSWQTVIPFIGYTDNGIDESITWMATCATGVITLNIGPGMGQSTTDFTLGQTIDGVQIEDTPIWGGNAKLTIEPR